MANDVSVSVTIGGRKYPLTVSSKDEAMVTSVAADLNQTIEKLKANYAVQDRQDLMAMAALQVAVKISASKQNTAPEHAEDTAITEEINALFNLTQELL